LNADTGITFLEFLSCTTFWMHLEKHKSHISGCDGSVICFIHC
jgi:hypothetical protein